MTKDALERAVKQLKDGDLSAFDAVYEATYKVVFFVAHGVLRQKEAAEDIVQDTYMAAVRNIDRYDQNNFLAWLTTIAKRLAINRYNKGKHEVFTDFQEETGLGTTTMPDDDSIGLIKLAEELLEPTDFRIVVMYAIAGYKRREIAQIENMPVSTVSHRYSQAIKALEKKLKGGGVK